MDDKDEGEFFADKLEIESEVTKSSGKKSVRKTPKKADSKLNSTLYKRKPYKRRKTKESISVEKEDTLATEDDPSRD